ncbi:hypothetical protein JCM16303_005239 [Sporobolomyces ruberrimus]
MHRLSSTLFSLVLATTTTLVASKPLILLPRQELATASPDFPSRAAPGLPDNGLKSSGIHLGFLPNWEQENPQLINQALGDSISIIGDYLNVSPDNYEFNQVDYHLNSVVKIATGKVKAVYCPAVIFSSTLDKWTPQMTENLAKKMKMVTDRGVTVWLRFLFEMNGGWMPYGLRPDLYVPLFREVTNAVRAQTNNTFMLYAPNVWNGPVDDQQQGYQIYFPGEEYVDLVGLSFYSLGEDKSANQAPDSSLFRDGFTPFYNLFSPSSASASSNILKLSAAYPIVIAETSAPYYYKIPPGSKYFLQGGDTDISTPLPNLTTYTPAQTSPPNPHSDDELFLKASWMVQLTSNVTAARFPNLRAVSWFNYLKKGSSEKQVLADFRFVGGNATVEQWVRQNFGNQTAYEEGYSGGTGRIGGGGGIALAMGTIVCATFLIL